MMDKLLDLVIGSDLPQLQKNMLLGFISRAKDDEIRKREQRVLVEQVASEKKVSDIILATDEVIIYTVSGAGEWELKYPFRSIFVNARGAWERCETVSPSLDLAYLVFLQKKHLGSNSQFVDFAMKMLEIPAVG
jgi:hypothetical protein